MTDKDRERRRKKFEEVYKPAYDAFIPLYPFTLDNLDGEEWLPVPYCADYHMSTFGRVKSFKNGQEKILKPQLSLNGYLFVNLCKNNKVKIFRVHRLVAQLFIPNPQNLPEVNHDDGVKFNCHVSNLYWATGSENMEHAVRTGLHKSGEDTYNAKLTNEQVVYIRENPDDLTTITLAEKFNVAMSTISEIQYGEKRKNDGGPIRAKKISYSHVSDEIKAKILAQYVKGSSEFGCYGLAKKFGFAPSTIWNIVHGK